MSRRYFGTDGVRGAYGGEVMNESFAERLGRAAGSWAGGAGRVFIGRDTRSSGASLADAVAKGLASTGLEPVMLGVVPTPAVALAMRLEPAALGVVVTASHNPAVDNGIKFFGPGGFKLSDKDEGAIERAMEALVGAPSSASQSWPSWPALDAYRGKMETLLPRGALSGWKIVVDTANGATTATTPAVLRALGAELVQIGDAPDGRNINLNVGSEHPAALCEAVRARGARLGVAHDGDGDRCILCDESGAILDGDEILTILALHSLAAGALRGGKLVITQQSNLGVDAAVRRAGGTTFRTGIGDRYVMEKMRAEDAVLGGESSGHIICADVCPTGDGLVAALRVIGVMLATGRPLSELRGWLVKFPQLTRNLRVRAKRDLALCPAINAAIASLETDLGETGRVLVRFSGTEAKLRLLVEGPNDAAVQDGIARLEAAARVELEVF